MSYFSYLNVLHYLTYWTCVSSIWTLNKCSVVHCNVPVSQYKCLWMCWSPAITLTCECRLVFVLIMTENEVKHSCNNVKKLNNEKSKVTLWVSMKCIWQFSALPDPAGMLCSPWLRPGFPLRQHKTCWVTQGRCLASCHIWVNSNCCALSYSCQSQLYVGGLIKIYFFFLRRGRILLLKPKIVDPLLLTRPHQHVSWRSRQSKHYTLDVITTDSDLDFIHACNSSIILLSISFVY